jgi:hypothetical protein
MSLKSLLDEVQIGVNEFRTLSGPALEPIGVERAADGVRMQPEFVCYCSDLPVFGVEQAADGCDLFRRDHW